MKTKLFCTAALLLTLATAIPTAAARQVMSWYFKKNSEHKQPSTDSDWWYLDKYDAFYVDKTKKAGTDAQSEDGDKVLYLTFDAGYENGNVSKIGEALKKHNATGAFFILSHLAKAEPELVKTLADNGNLICNHTSRHRDMTRCADAADFEKELRELEQTARDCAGVRIAPYYRPPEGKFCEKNLQWAQAMGYRTVFWSFAYCDWDNENQPNEEEAFKTIMDHTHNGAVILLHPTSATNAALMDRLLTEWEAQGYRFGTLDELYDNAVKERERIAALPETLKRNG